MPIAAIRPTSGQLPWGQAKRRSQSYLVKEEAQQNPIRTPSAPHHLHLSHEGAGRTPLSWQRTDGRKDDSHHLLDAGELRDDYDRGLLQPQPSDVFLKWRAFGLLARKMGQVAGAPDGSKRKGGCTIGGSGAAPKNSKQIA